MSRLAARVVLGFGVLAFTGCGTIGNLQGRDRIYGGVGLDAKEAWRAGKELIVPADPPEYTVKEDAAILVYACVDTPMSLIMDTFTLPITVTKTVVHWVKGTTPPAENPLQPVGGPVKPTAPVTTTVPVTTTAEPPLPNRL